MCDRQLTPDQNLNLEELALALKQYPPETLETKKRKIALNWLIHAIQKSGKLFCKGRYDFPPQVYTEALQETWLYVCRKVHEYDSASGKVMTWVNFILDKKFKNAIKKYRKEQRTGSLDEPIKNYNSADGYEMTLGATIASPETTFDEYEIVRLIIEKDVDGKFKNRHIQNYPKANFQEIALRRLDKQSWKAMSEELRIPVPTLSRFYQRSIEYFGLEFREYF